MKEFADIVELYPKLREVDENHPAVRYDRESENHYDEKAQDLKATICIWLFLILFTAMLLLQGARAVVDTRWKTNVPQGYVDGRK